MRIEEGGEEGGEEGRRPRPIFVLGLQRSGTTWIANMLEAHPEIAAVSAARHRGVHESIFFSHFARSYGPLGEDAAFARFAADFTASDYFRLSGMDAGRFLAARPRDYAAAFRLVMEEVAARKKARYWLEKSPHHTPLCDELARLFPDALFIAITRDSASLTRSRLSAYGRVPPAGLRRVRALCRAGFANAFYRRLVERFHAGNPGRCLRVTFEDLRADHDGEIRRIAGFLGIDGRPELFEPRFAANSSFTGDRPAGTSPPALPGASPRGSLGRGDRLLRLAEGACRLLPLAPLAGLRRFKENRGPAKWPDWCWTMEERPSGRRAGAA